MYVKFNEKNNSHFNWISILNGAQANSISSEFQQEVPTRCSIIEKHQVDCGTSKLLFYGVSGWRRREYGAVIYYSTARGYRRDGLDRGTSNDIDLTISRRNDEMIVALVHSHPRNGGDAPSNEDWDIADLLFDTNRAKESSFSHYILSGDDKKIYEFDTSDRSRRSGRRSDHDDANGVCNV